MLYNGKVNLNVKGYYETVLKKLQEQAEREGKDESWIQRELEYRGLA